MDTRTRTTILCFFALAASIAGCKGSPPTTGPSQTAQLQVSASPATITPIVCPPSSCGSAQNQLEAATTITIRETAGVAGRVTTIAVTLRRNSDNTVLANGTITPAPEARFAGNAAVTIPIGVHWDRSQAAGAATLTAVVNATDDNNHQVSATLAIPVNAFSS